MPAPLTPFSAAVRVIASTTVVGAILFLAAGTLDWPAAWAYLAIVTVIMATYTVIVLRIHPDLADERRRPPADAKRWDKPFTAAVAVLGPAALILLSGFDRRYHWSPPLPAWIEVAGLVLGAAGGMFTNTAVAANRFFSALVRIQHDRGHHVIDTGPYRFVRHPGYAGSIVYMFGMAVALGSRAAVAATAVIVLVLVVRTALEDRTLRAELEGYADYARRVRFRLVPGVW
jgi:protein-S-isoprenylcysteine O-methyltransferase Ste14